MSLGEKAPILPSSNHHDAVLFNSGVRVRTGIDIAAGRYPVGGGRFEMLLIIERCR
jgi:hypothetical protein